jgi:hypothetical protein
MIGPGNQPPKVPADDSSHSGRRGARKVAGIDGIWGEDVSIEHMGWSRWF